MKKHIVNEATGISYTLVGDYYIPDLKLPETENKPIGIWGRKRLTYLKEHKKILFNQLVYASLKLGYFKAGLSLGECNNEAVLYVSVLASLKVLLRHNELAQVLCRMCHKSVR